MLKKAAVGEEGLHMDMKDSRKNFIEKFLYASGIPVHMKGYGYLVAAVEIAMEDYSKLNAMTKELYPEVGQKFGVRGDCVEHAIRTVINAAHCTGDLWLCDFRKPTNRELISSAVMNLRFGMGEHSR